MELTQVQQNRVAIDQNASIIETEAQRPRQSQRPQPSIGTTGWGVGPAIEERVRRTAKLAKESPNSNHT